VNPGDSVSVQFADTTAPQFDAHTVTSIGLDTVVLKVTVDASDGETLIATGSSQLTATFTITPPQACNKPARIGSELASVKTAASSAELVIQHEAGECFVDDGGGVGHNAPENMTVVYHAHIVNQAGLAADFCGNRTGQISCP
jgi:hypothetical protein